MELTEVLDKIEAVLCQQINQIQPLAIDDEQQQAQQRLQQLAKNIPNFISILSEPWLVEPITPHTQQILLDCACIHLCARVVDDAIDENLAIHRQNLLFMQPLYWQTLLQMGARYSPHYQACITLIKETVIAVAEDDKQANPQQLGAKNHHLLLVPLLLSNNSDAYVLAKDSLSLMMAMAQAKDEWVQGEFKNADINEQFFGLLHKALSPHHISCLKKLGWHYAAQRIVDDARFLIHQFKKNSTLFTLE